ncbi:MAG: ester cyclase [Solirubrobacterales bacterium]
MATETKTRTGRKKGAKTIAKEYFEAVANQDVDAMMSMWEPGGKGYIYGMVDLEVPGTYSAWFRNLFRAFPDFRFEVLDIVASGDQAAVRWRATGTFDGPAKFEGLSPTGARVSVEGIDLLTIRDGKIHQNLAYTNSTEMGRQLGAMPPAGSVGEKLMLGSVNARTAAGEAIRKLRDRR